MSPRTARLLLAGGIALIAVCVALEIAIPADHGPHWTAVWFHSVPGFNALLGFVGCVLLVKVSKGLGKLWLQRPDDYYGEQDGAVEPDLPAAHGAHGHGAHGHGAHGHGQGGRHG